MDRKMSFGPWLLGLAILTVGVLFLLDTTGLVDGLGSTWWPLLLIIWGLGIQVAARAFNVAGTVVLLLGVGFLLEHLEVVGEGWLGRYWPVALVVVGVSVLLSALQVRRPPRRPPMEDRASGDDWLEATVTMAGRKDHVTSQAWRGGRATAVMGGVELDLRDAKPVPEGAVLHTMTVMGGVEVRVPAEWEVVVRGTPFLGGFDDKTEHHPGSEPGMRPRLEITGTAVLGGVEVKN